VGNPEKYNLPDEYYRYRSCHLRFHLSKALAQIVPWLTLVRRHSHVIAANGTKEGGYLDPTDLDRQLAVLNEAYEPQKISFKSASMELVIEPEWADNCKEEAMKTALQQGTYADLNVYFFPKILCQSGEVVGHDQLIGYSTMPTIASSTEMLLSGVHVRADVVPGGDLEYYDLGASAVHEVGHWLGRTYYCRTCG
jgi:hypothetical protein